MWERNLAGTSSMGNMIAELKGSQDTHFVSPNRKGISSRVPFLLLLTLSHCKMLEFLLGKGLLLGGLEEDNDRDKLYLNP